MLSTFTQFYRCDQVGVAADKAVITDHTTLLLQTVIVDGDSAAAEVDFLAHVAVAYVCQVSNGSLLAHGGSFLDFHEVADLDTVFQV